MSPSAQDKNQVNIGDGAQVGQIAVGSNITQTQINNNFFGDPAQARNRRDMLALVTNTWIHGVLDQSLNQVVMLELGLQTQPSAVERTWDVHLQMPDQPAQDIPHGTPIIQLFDQLNGAMLILGAPGAGKTTMLLQLARDLIERAKQDPLLRIPVVLNLSSWSAESKPIPEWLVTALSAQYQVSKKLAREWVDNEALLLLLDGLDEVQMEKRAACVHALNEYRRDHGSVPVVITSRIADYDALKSRLSLRGAVFIQPLSAAQIDAYLNRAGPELAGVRDTLQHDPTLLELVEQPLMLSIMTLAYRGVSATELASESFRTAEARRKHLFDTYIEKMFHRVARTKNKLYTTAATKHWLTWLAQQMMKHREFIFFFDSLRRSWLPTFEESRAETLNRLAGGMIAGIICCLITGLVSGLTFGLTLGLVCGVVVGLASSFLTLDEELILLEQLKWSSKTWAVLSRTLIRGVVSAVKVGLVSGLIGVVLSSVAGGLGGWWGVLIFGLVGGLMIGVPFAMAFGMPLGTFVDYKLMVIGLVFGLVIGLVGGLVIWLGGGLALGLVAGLGWGLLNGGYAVINHFTLRLLLTRANSMPLNYVRFLDYAAERILLRKVGGGYIFIHRMLMEHFAAMESEKQSNQVRSG